MPSLVRLRHLLLDDCQVLTLDGNNMVLAEHVHDIHLLLIS